MTQAAINTTTQAADAILALINSRPRTPTRDEIMGALANLRPEAGNDNRPDYPHPLPPLRMRPTELGWEMIEKLMPAYCEAVRYDCCLADDDPDKAEIEEWCSDTCDALWDAARECSNLVDLAIAYRFAIDGDTPQQLFAAAKRWEKEHGEKAPETSEDAVGTSDLIAYRLVSTILQMAGIDEGRCSTEADWVKRGWYDADHRMINPTPAERQEALARLRAQPKAA